MSESDELFFAEKAFGRVMISLLSDVSWVKYFDVTHLTLVLKFETL